MSKSLLVILFSTLVISGCVFSNSLEKKFIKMKNITFSIPKSKFVIANFDSAVENIVSEILKYNNIFVYNKTVFFIDILDNQTNVLIENEKLTDLIKNTLSKHTKNIYYIDRKIIEKSKKKLGISNINKSLDNSTAVLLARKNNAKYYLYSSISGENQPFVLKIKLILVQTGEIVFMQTKKFFW